MMALEHSQGPLTRWPPAEIASFQTLALLMVDESHAWADEGVKVGVKAHKYAIDETCLIWE
jgi:hypothetical protein